MRWLYTLIFYCSLPLMVGRLLWRARLAPAYAQRLGERFGFFSSRPEGKPVIWVHAVSVGETLAALPMIKQLQLRYPGYDLVITTTTPTGSERVRAALGDSVFHVYAPYDLPDCLSRFLNRTRPQLAIIMETELWPNTVFACHSREIPVLVANARLSAKSARGYARFRALARPMLEAITLIAAQHRDDGERFLQLGLQPQSLSVTGNIKFDLTLDASLKKASAGCRQRWQAGSQRPILLAASTHEGEDVLLLQAFESLLLSRPDLLLVLVPRHPERFTSVVELAAERHQVRRHSEGGVVAASIQVVVGDTMGEMLALIGASDLVFMGGTWVANGGHNFIEPAAWAKPIVSGPSLFNFAEVSRLLLEVGGMQVVETPAELVQAIIELLQNPVQARVMGESAQRVADANRGALGKLLGRIDDCLPSR